MMPGMESLISMKGGDMLTEQQAKELCHQLVTELPGEVFNELTPKVLSEVCKIINKNIKDDSCKSSCEEKATSL